MKSQRVWSAMLGVGVLGAGLAQAADRFWANAGTDFNDNDSWTVSAPGTGDRAVFAAEAVTNPHLGASRTLQGLVFAPNSTTTTVPGPEGGGYTLSGASGTKLTLTHGGTHSGARPIYQNTTGNNLITADLELSASTARRELEIRAGEIELASVLSSVGDVVVAFGSQSGTVLTMSGNNSFTGSFEHRGAGTLLIAHANALSTSILLFGQHGGTATGAMFDNLTGGHLTLPGSNSMMLTGGDGIRFLGTHSLSLGTGGITLSDSDAGRHSPIRVDGARMTVGGTVTETVSHQLIKRGPGTLELLGASSYTGITQIQGGVLLINHADALGPNALQLRGSSDGFLGVLGLGTGDFTRAVGTSAGEVAWVAGGGLFASGGFAAYNADRIVNLGGGAAPVTWGTANFCGQIFVLGADDADAMVDFRNPIEVPSFGREIRVNNGLAEVDGRLSGALSGTAPLTKSGTGTLELSAANTHTGSLTIQAGRLLVTGSTSTGSVTVNVDGALGGTGSINGDVSVFGTLGPGSPAGTLELKKNLTLQDGARLGFKVGTASDKVLLTGTSPVLSNLGGVSCAFELGDGFNSSGTYVLLDWSGATTPNVAGLDPEDFTLENDDVQATFAIAGSTLVVTFKPLLDPATVLILR